MEYNYVYVHCKTNCILWKRSLRNRLKGYCSRWNNQDPKLWTVTLRTDPKSTYLWPLTRTIPPKLHLPHSRLSPTSHVNISRSPFLSRPKTDRCGYQTVSRATCSPPRLTTRCTCVETRTGKLTERAVWHFLLENWCLLAVARVRFITRRLKLTRNGLTINFAARSDGVPRGSLNGRCRFSHDRFRR